MLGFFSSFANVLLKDITGGIDLPAQEQTGNPNWRLGSKQVHCWATGLKELQKEAALHRQRIGAADAWAGTRAAESGWHV